jgi:hypothetical protein
MELRPDDVLVLLVAVSAHMAVHVPVLSYPMPDLKANMTDGLSELLDDLPGPGAVLDALDDSRGDLLDALDDQSDLDDLLDDLPSPTIDLNDE